MGARFYELALKCSGAVQAARWSRDRDGGGYIYSFNGPHSLFVDTIRSARALVVAHQLGHVLMGENDRKISLLDRAIEHGLRDRAATRSTTAKDATHTTSAAAWRTRASSTATTAISAVRARSRATRRSARGRAASRGRCAASPNSSSISTRCRRVMRRSAPSRRRARATCDFYIENTPPDGIPYWDTGAPGLVELGDWRSTPADPYNPHEPVDSSAAAIAAQGLLRLGRRLEGRPLLAGRPGGMRHVVRRAVPQHEPGAPGADSAFGLSPPERVELAAWRVVDVGRLSRARGRFVSAAPGRRTARI